MASEQVRLKWEVRMDWNAWVDEFCGTGKSVCVHGALLTRDNCACDKLLIGFVRGKRASKFSDGRCARAAAKAHTRKPNHSKSISISVNGNSNWRSEANWRLLVFAVFLSDGWGEFRNRVIVCGMPSGNDDDDDEKEEEKEAKKGEKCVISRRNRCCSIFN